MPDSLSVSSDLVQPKSVIWIYPGSLTEFTDNSSAKRKSGNAGNRTRDLWICSHELLTLCFCSYGCELQSFTSVRFVLRSYLPKPSNSLRYVFAAYNGSVVGILLYNPMVRLNRNMASNKG
jgi:hypothetical protein